MRVDLAESFIEWALDPARNLEERFATLTVVEMCVAWDEVRRKVYDNDFEKRRAMWKARKLNPAYVPVLKEEEVRIAAGQLEGLISFSTHASDDRPIRDLEVLRFTPNLETLSLSGCAIEHYEFMRHLPKVHTLYIHGDDTEDMRGIGHCRSLRFLHIRNQCPWPRLDGWEQLVSLETLVWHGSGLAFLSVPELPALRRFYLEYGHHHTQGVSTIKDFNQLPAMPLLEHFTGWHFYRLDGIERYPRLRSLVIAGCFPSLEKLACLKQLTHLTIGNDEISDIKPLLAVPELHQLRIRTKRPHDYSFLAEAPQLREVRALGCDVPQVDLHTLSHILSGWEDRFAAAEPRPLPPLVLRAHYKDQTVNPPESFAYSEYDETGWHGNRLFQESEEEWVRLQLVAALEDSGLMKLPGIEVVGRHVVEEHVPFIWFSHVNARKRELGLRLHTIHAISRLRDIIACIRGVFVRTRYRWSVLITGDPNSSDYDYLEQGRKRTPEEEAEDERSTQEHFEKKRKEEQEYLARELRLRMLKEDGQEPNPADFNPPPPPKDEGKGGGVATLTKTEDEEPPPMKFDPPNLDYDNRDDEDDSEGGLAEGEPGQEDNDEHWLPLPPHVDPNTFWAELVLYITVTEDYILTGRQRVTSMEYLMDLKTEWPDEPEEQK